MANHVNRDDITQSSYGVTSAQMITALLFVPGVYFVLLLSIMLIIFIGGGMIAGIYFLCAKVFHMIPVMILSLLSIGIVIGIFSTLLGIISTLIKKPSFEPAILLDNAKEPALASFIDNLCKGMGTHPPSAIILHATTDFFVTQGSITTFNGRAKGRIVSISLPLLYILSVDELRAIISHELAHFTGKDTLYSAFVLPVYSSTSSTLDNMDKAIMGINASSRDTGCMMLPLIIPQMLLTWYVNKFHVVNMDISRLREIRADHIAAVQCGYSCFTSSLKKVIGVSGCFNNLISSHITNALMQGKVFNNYYEYFRDNIPSLHKAFNDNINKAMNDHTTAQGSHPPLKLRLTYIPKTKDNYCDKIAAISLLKSPVDYEIQLTNSYTALLNTALKGTDK